ncbi:11375_t:CDS:2, partial [Gigaspora rosea]
FFEDAHISYMDICTGSNHNLAAASFNVHGLISNNLPASNHKKQDKRVFEYEKAKSDSGEASITTQIDIDK